MEHLYAWRGSRSKLHLSQNCSINVIISIIATVSWSSESEQWLSRILKCCDAYPERMRNYVNLVARKTPNGRRIENYCEMWTGKRNVMVLWFVACTRAPVRPPLSSLLNYSWLEVHWSLLCGYFDLSLPHISLDAFAHPNYSILIHIRIRLCCRMRRLASIQSWLVSGYWMSALGYVSNFQL